MGLRTFLGLKRPYSECVERAAAPEPPPPPQPNPIISAIPKVLIPFQDHGLANNVVLGENVSLRGSITGNNNTITIEAAKHKSTIDMAICGNNNTVVIGPNSNINGLNIRIGNHAPAHRVRIDIGSDFTLEKNCQFILFRSGYTLSIGDDCMFSNGITIRAGESPHLIFDRKTGEYLDTSEGVFIGDHVWVGERAYITKRATIPGQSIVAACAVVTSRFDEPYVVLAGNPAKITRRDVEWFRNRHKLDERSPYFASFYAQPDAPEPKREAKAGTDGSPQP